MPAGTRSVDPCPDDDVTIVSPPPSLPAIDGDERTRQISGSRIRMLVREVSGEGAGEEPTRIGPRPDSRPPAGAPTPAEPRGRRRRWPIAAVLGLLAAVVLLGAWRRARPTPRRSTVTSSASATASAPSSAASYPARVAQPAPPARPAGDERAAVEAVASGAYAQAARIYESLAASHPSDDAFREAARVLRDRSEEVSR